MSATILRALFAPLLLSAFGSCAAEKEPAPPSAPAPAPSAAAPDAGAHAAKPVDTSAPKSAAGLPVLAAQPGWVEEAPTSGMRKAQYRLPHGEESGEDASLVVYYFGSGGGGTREANLDRWTGQFTQPDGSESAKALKSSTRKVGGFDVLDAQLSGTYVAETAPGSGVRLNKPDWRMLASIVETSEGPWYFKLVGPTATVAKWEASYGDFLNAMTPAR